MKNHIAALEAKVKRQARELQEKDCVIIHYKKSLKTLNYIWCTGGCYPNKDINIESLIDCRIYLSRLEQYFFNREGRNGRAIKHLEKMYLDSTAPYATFKKPTIYYKIRWVFITWERKVLAEKRLIINQENTKDFTTYIGINNKLLVRNKVERAILRLIRTFIR